MTDSWTDPRGTKRFFCSMPPGEEGQGGIIPSVFLGKAHWPYSGGAIQTPALPQLNITTGDFSMEVWARRKFGNSPGGDTFFWTGLMGDSANFGFPYCAINWQTNADRVDVYFDFNADGAAPLRINNQVPDRLGQWSLYQVNCDRDGDMSLWIDTGTKGTVDISGQAGSLGGAVEVFPLQGEDPSNVYEGTFATWSYAILPVVIGPFAIHNRLLTAAEREESYRYRKTNLFGSATTLIAFDWHELRGVTGWDDTLDRMVNGLRAGLPVPGGAPLGASGDVTVEDISGNENHWTLPTSASYGTAVPAPFTYVATSKYDFGFGGDVIFRA